MVAGVRATGDELIPTAVVGVIHGAMPGYQIFGQIMIIRSGAESNRAHELLRIAPSSIVFGRAPLQTDGMLMIAFGRAHENIFRFVINSEIRRRRGHQWGWGCHWQANLLLEPVIECTCRQHAFSPILSSPLELRHVTMKILQIL